MKFLIMPSILMAYAASSYAGPSQTTVCTHTKEQCYQVCKLPLAEPAKNSELCPADALGGEWACSCATPDSSLPGEPSAPAGFSFMGCMYQEGCNTQLCGGRAYRFFYDTEHCDVSMIACFCSEK